MWIVQAEISEYIHPKPLQYECSEFKENFEIEIPSFRKKNIYQTDGQWQIYQCGVQRQPQGAKVRTVCRQNERNFA